MGINLLGFSEKEVGQMTLRKYNELFEWHKYFYNMQQKRYLYSSIETETENEDDEDDQEIVLF